jgi:dienelactone hydrolase
VAALRARRGGRRGGPAHATKGLVAALSILAACTSGRGAVEGPEQRETIAGREVLVWAPPDASTPRPVVIFSHGFHGCAQQSRFLTEALARRGYWVFAPNHRDARCGGGRGAGLRPEVPFRKPERWSDASHADRAEDVRAILGALADGPDPARPLDLGQLALVGHSLGGYTVLGLAGAWESWKLPGVRAVLALSPYAEPFLVHDTLRDLGAPVMYQGGTLDLGITPALRRPGGAYDRSPAPKYFVELGAAGHFAWTDLGGRAHSRILHYGLAFLDRYLRGASGDALTRSTPGVSTLRWESELGAGAARAPGSGAGSG